MGDLLYTDSTESPTASSSQRETVSLPPATTLASTLQGASKARRWVGGESSAKRAMHMALEARSEVQAAPLLRQGLQVEVAVLNFARSRVLLTCTRTAPGGGGVGMEGQSGG